MSDKDATQLIDARINMIVKVDCEGADHRAVKYFTVHDSDYFDQWSDFDGETGKLVGGELNGPEWSLDVKFEESLTSVPPSVIYFVDNNNNNGDLITSNINVTDDDPNANTSNQNTENSNENTQDNDDNKKEQTQQTQETQETQETQQTQHAQHAQHAQHTQQTLIDVQKKHKWADIGGIKDCVFAQLYEINAIITRIQRKNKKRARYDAAIIEQDKKEIEMLEKLQQEADNLLRQQMDQVSYIKPIFYHNNIMVEEIVSLITQLPIKLMCKPTFLQQLQAKDKLILQSIQYSGDYHHLWHHFEPDSQFWILIDDYLHKKKIDNGTSAALKIVCVAICLIFANQLVWEMTDESFDQKYFSDKKPSKLIMDLIHDCLDCPDFAVLIEQEFFYVSQLFDWLQRVLKYVHKNDGKLNYLQGRLSYYAHIKPIMENTVCFNTLKEIINEKIVTNTLTPEMQVAFKHAVDSYKLYVPLFDRLFTQADHSDYLGNWQFWQSMTTNLSTNITSPSIKIFQRLTAQDQQVWLTGGAYVGESWDPRVDDKIEDTIREWRGEAPCVVNKKQLRNIDKLSDNDTDNVCDYLEDAVIGVSMIKILGYKFSKMMAQQHSSTLFEYFYGLKQLWQTLVTAQVCDDFAAFKKCILSNLIRESESSKLIYVFWRTPSLGYIAKIREINDKFGKKEKKYPLRLGGVSRILTKGFDYDESNDNHNILQLDGNGVDSESDILSDIVPASLRSKSGNTIVSDFIPFGIDTTVASVGSSNGSSTSSSGSSTSSSGSSGDSFDEPLIHEGFYNEYGLNHNVS